MVSLYTDEHFPLPVIAITTHFRSRSTNSPGSGECKS